MIRSHFGLTQNPFDRRELDLLPGQQEIVDTLKVHCQQGGLCLVLGVPGTGKSVVKQALQKLPEKQYLVATVARTLHTYTNTVKILCEAFRVAFEHSAFQCERKLIEEAFASNHAGKCLTTSGRSLRRRRSHHSPSTNKAAVLNVVVFADVAAS